MSETPSSSETSSTDGDLGSPPAHLFPDLPDDIGLQCIARVPRFYHCDLSLVCKSWRSVIRSPIFFSTRFRLNCTEYSLYINLSIHGSSFNWFVLHQNPQNPRNLSRVPPIPSQAMGSAFVVLGPRIYVIGGSISRIPSSSVWIFDSRSNKWEIGPEMHVGRAFAAAGVVNGKIYVMGGCLVDLLDQSSNWAEVFDPAIGSWAPVPSPVEVRKKRMLWSAIMWEKIYAMSDQGGVVYYPGEASWRHVSFSIDLGWRGEAAIIDGILYFYDNSLRKIRGYDLKERIFKNLEGVELDWPPNHLCGTTMVNVGGRLYMVWRNGTGEQIDIWCVEVDVHKDGRGGLCGSIVWSQVILVIPSLSSSIIRCLVVEL